MTTVRLLHRNTYLERWWECRWSAFASWYQPQVKATRHGEEPKLLKKWEMIEDPYARPDFFRRGSASHDALLEVFTASMEDRDIDVYAIVREVCQALPRWQQAEVLDLIIRFQENLIDDPIRPDWVISLEESFTVEVGDRRRFVFTPDVVELNSQRGHPQAGLIVTDWKTNWQVQTQADFELDPQLQRYGTGLLEAFPRINRVLLRKRFVRYPGVVREMILTREDAVKVREEMWRRMSMVDDAVYDYLFTGDERPVRATGGEWCGACIQRPTCPVVKYWEARTPETLDFVPNSVQDASRVLSGQMALQARAELLKAGVKAFSARDEFQYMEHGAGYYSFRPKTVRVAPDLNQVTAVIKAIQEDPDLVRKLFKLDLKAWDREIQNLPVPLVTAVDKVIVRDFRTEWRFTKGEPPQPKLPEPKPPKDPESIDLMDALQRSLEPKGVTDAEDKDRDSGHGERDGPVHDGGAGEPVPRDELHGGGERGPEVGGGRGAGAPGPDAPERLVEGTVSVDGPAQSDSCPSPPGEGADDDPGPGDSGIPQEGALITSPAVPEGLACEHDDCFEPAVTLDENGDGLCVEHTATALGEGHTLMSLESYFDGLRDGTLPPGEVTIGAEPEESWGSPEPGDPEEPAPQPAAPGGPDSEAADEAEDAPGDQRAGPGEGGVHGGDPEGPGEGEAAEAEAARQPEEVADDRRGEAEVPGDGRGEGGAVDRRDAPADPTAGGSGPGSGHEDGAGDDQEGPADPGADMGGGIVPHWEQVHRCPCGKEFKGNAYYRHAKRCWHNTEHFDHTLH